MHGGLVDEDNPAAMCTGRVLFFTNVASLSIVSLTVLWSAEHIILKSCLEIAVVVPVVVL